MPLSAWPACFYLGAALGGLAILILLLAVPAPSMPPSRGGGTEPQAGSHLRDLKKVFMHGGLLRLNYSIFTSHLILMANFVVVPVALRDFAGLQTAAHWQLYLAVLFLSLFIMVPFIILSERRHKTRLFFILSILLILLSQAGLWFFHTGYLLIGAWLTLFFGAYNYLEAFLPSEVSKIVAPDKKGRGPRPLFNRAIYRNIHRRPGRRCLAPTLRNRRGTPALPAHGITLAAAHRPAGRTPR